MNMDMKEGNILLVIQSICLIAALITFFNLENIENKFESKAHAAMSVATLKARLVTEISAVITVDDATQLNKMAEAIAKAVYEEITINAVVTVTGVSSGGETAPGTIQ